jgi:signal transduction histidine kinase/CheY-like chemotaxis protein
MTSRLCSIPLRNERDVVQARQRAREIAAILGFDNQDQIRLATATSEMARNAFRYAREAQVAFEVTGQEPQELLVYVSDHGPGIPNLEQILEGRYQSRTGMGLGIIGTRRLMDSFAIDSNPFETVVRMGKALPATTAPVTELRAHKIASMLEKRPTESPYEEIERQNRELLKTFQELRARQEELAILNRELEDTNRGVVALYAELDERADYLRRASELKTNFISNISHEFRTPLNSIISLSRMLLDRFDGDLTTEQEKQVEFIAKSARTLSDLVNDLLDIAKVEAGKVKIRVKTFSVAELFSALKGMLKPLLAHNTSVDLVFEDVSDLPLLRTDEGKVSQILRNFISNAIKFTPQGEVRVSASATDHKILFRVQDTGIGIAPEHHETIFEEFTQLENPLQAQFKGTGLGLPLCRSLARLLGGGVSVESELGRGSTFLAEIPTIYSGDVAKQPLSSETWSPEFHRPPVLLVDSDPEMFRRLEVTFRTSEFQLIYAEGPQSAVRWLKRNTPVAVLCECGAGGSVLRDLAGHLAAGQNGNTTCSIIALDSPEMLPAAADFGVDLFLTKPLEKDVLAELRRLTNRQRPRKLLLVENNDVSLYILRELLDRPWLSLLEARSGQEALEAVSREHPDAIILDLLMPGMDGFEVLRNLRAREEFRELPVIVCTSKNLSHEDKARLESLHAGVISKADVTSNLAPELILKSLEQMGIAEPRNV